MAIYFQRLSVYHLPPAAAIVSVFLPLGPCGQGDFAILQMSSVIRNLTKTTGVGLGGGSLYDSTEQMIMSNAIYGFDRLCSNNLGIGVLLVDDRNFEHHKNGECFIVTI